jgi:hypothetical protein
MRNEECGMSADPPVLGRGAEAKRGEKGKRGRGEKEKRRTGRWVGNSKFEIRNLKSVKSSRPRAGTARVEGSGGNVLTF